MIALKNHYNNHDKIQGTILTVVALKKNHYNNHVKIQCTILTIVALYKWYLPQLMHDHSCRTLVFIFKLSFVIRDKDVRRCTTKLFGRGTQ